MREEGGGRREEGKGAEGRRKDTAEKGRRKQDGIGQGVGSHRVSVPDCVGTTSQERCRRRTRRISTTRAARRLLLMLLLMRWRGDGGNKWRESIRW